MNYNFYFYDYWIFKTFIILHNEHVRAQEFEQVEPLIWETAKYM